jgi:uncharacterized repeat protein (TIGR01451 family)
VAISAGAGHSLAAKSNGTLWAWGDNTSGQLGDGTRTTRLMPVQTNFSGIIAVAAGTSHSLAIQSYSCPIATQSVARFVEQELTAVINPFPSPFPTCTRVLAWGAGGSGQLGNGGNFDSNTPVVVSGLSNVVAVAAGHLHSLALKADGTVWAWGYNESGQLGNGSNIDRNTPVQVVGLSGITAISAGGIHSVALRSDGTVAAWGAGGLGQLGNGFYNDSNVPVTSWLFPTVVAISAGPMYTVALKADGTGWGFGWNHYDQLGHHSAGQWTNTPVQVEQLERAHKISAGGGHVIAIENPRASVSPASVNYGNVPVNSQVCQTVHLTNGADDALLLNAISITGANAGDFTFNWPFLPISLAFNVSLPIPVCFTPSAAGLRTATIVFDDYSWDGPHSVSLSGNGAVSADLAVSQTVAVDGRRLTYTVNVRNNGPAAAVAMTMKDAVPAQTQLVGISGPGCSVLGIIAPTTCKPITLPSGSQATYTVVVNVTARESTLITNIVSVASSSQDPDMRNNVSKLVTPWTLTK